MIGAGAFGFVTGLSLILAIGAQNTFVLRQGLLKKHVFWLCLFAALSDALLIIAGVAGLASLIGTISWLPSVMMAGGAAFLIWYGLSRLWCAWLGEYNLVLKGQGVGLWRCIAIMAAFTWLNPHVYLDTLGLVGTISLRFEPGLPRIAYACGAVVSSFVFFFGLGYGARFASPIMKSARAWRILDSVIGVVMCLIAARLIVEFFKHM